MADEPTPIQLPEIPEDLEAVPEADLRALYADLQTVHAALLAEREASEGLTLSRIRELNAQTLAAREAMTKIGEVVTEMTTVPESPEGIEDLPSLPDPTAEVTDPTDPEAGDPAVAPAVDPAAVTAAAGLTADELAAQRGDAPGTGPVSQGGDADARPRVASLRIPDNARENADSDITFDEMGARITDIFRGSRTDGKTRVASLPAFESHAELRDQLLSKGNGPIRTDEQIAEAVADWRSQYDSRRAAAREQGARMAAICDPLDIIREIPNAVGSSEPFSDSLPSRPAGRLGFQFTDPMALADVSAGVGVWTQAQQTSVDPDDPDTWKPIVDIACGNVRTVTADAVVGAARFDNTTEMSSPERIRDLMSVLAGQRARAKEAHLLTIMDTLTSHFDYVAPYGALAGVIDAMLTALPQGEYTNRLADGTPFVYYLPPGVLELLTIDTVNKAYVTDGDRRQVALEIEDAASRAGWNVSVVDLEDVAGTTNDPTPPFSALPAAGITHRTPLPGLGHTYRLRLLPPEAFIYASTGVIDYGVERSPELNLMNKAQVFAEEYVMLAKHSPFAAFTIHATLCGNGSRAGLATPFTCSASTPS